MLPARDPGRPAAGEAPSFALTTARPMLNDAASQVNGDALSIGHVQLARAGLRVTAAGRASRVATKTAKFRAGWLARFIITCEHG
jgi:hypothetical protein